MVLTVKRHTKQSTGPKKAARREIALTIDQRLTEPNLDTSHNTETEHGTTAPNTRTTIERVRIQWRKRAENLDESNMSGGNANSPTRMGQMGVQKSKEDRGVDRRFHRQARREHHHDSTISASERTYQDFKYTFLHTIHNSLHHLHIAPHKQTMTN